MSGGMEQLVVSGPLLLAMPVAAAAGAVTFLSPCVLPLVPGYLSYVTGMSGAVAESSAARQAKRSDPSPTGTGAAQVAASAVTSAGTAGAAGTPAGTLVGTEALAAEAGPPAPAVPAATDASVQAQRRGRVVTGTALFVLGFSALFAAYGVAFGSIGFTLKAHEEALARVLGCLIILMGLLFVGAFDRFTFAGRIARPSFRPRAGLAGAPLLGVMFGLGWTPCIGPTLGAVLTLSATTGTAGRGALLAFVYGLGIGIPFLIVAVAFQRGMNLLGFAKRHARLVTRIGGVMLIAVGLLEVTGTWAAAVSWVQVHLISGYTPPI
jgi:cytochrome c-type biogenesis protein